MEDQSEVAIYLALGSLVMFSLIIVIILFVVVYQRKILEKENRIKVIEQEKQIQLFKATVEAEEMQKEKIANNLHDGVNPLLSLIKLNLSRHKIEFEKDKFSIDMLKEDAQIIDQAIDGIRASCRDLIPSYLMEFGIIKTLEDYVRNLNKQEEINAEIILNVETDCQLNKQDQLAAYRISMELLNNLQKHANYKNIQLAVLSKKNLFELKISHNGKGISNEEIEVITESSKGQGLRSLKVRTLLLNAKIDYIKGPTNSNILLQIPIQ